MNSNIENIVRKAYLCMNSYKKMSNYDKNNSKELENYCDDCILRPKTIHRLKK